MNVYSAGSCFTRMESISRTVSGPTRSWRAAEASRSTSCRFRRGPCWRPMLSFRHEAGHRPGGQEGPADGPYPVPCQAGFPSTGIQATASSPPPISVGDSSGSAPPGPGRLRRPGRGTPFRSKSSCCCCDSCRSVASPGCRYSWRMCVGHIAHGVSDRRSHDQGSATLCQEQLQHRNPHPSRHRLVMTS
jgi:hypothetical protein